MLFPHEAADGLARLGLDHVAIHHVGTFEGR